MTAFCTIKKGCSIYPRDPQPLNICKQISAPFIFCIVRSGRSRQTPPFYLSLEDDAKVRQLSKLTKFSATFFFTAARGGGGGAFPPTPTSKAAARGGLKACLSTPSEQGGCRGEPSPQQIRNIARSLTGSQRREKDCKACFAVFSPPTSKAK